MPLLLTQSPRPSVCPLRKVLHVSSLLGGVQQRATRMMKAYGLETRRLKGGMLSGCINI